MLVLSFYTTWYLIRPDAKPNQNLYRQLQHSTILLVLVMGILWVLHVVTINPTFNPTFIAYIGSLKRLSILVSVIFGSFLFKETDFKKRFWAAVIIVIGAMLIAMDDLPARLATRITGFGI